MSDYKSDAKASRKGKMSKMGCYADGGTASQLWDGFKAGAKDFAEDARKVVTGDTSGTTFDNRKALFDQSKQKDKP